MTTKSLTAANPANGREVSMMTGKAMCAYANLVKASEAGMLNAATAYESEYEATVRCLEMFVRENIYEVQRIVRERAESELLAS